MTSHGQSKTAKSRPKDCRMAEINGKNVDGQEEHHRSEPKHCHTHARTGHTEHTRQDRQSSTVGNRRQHRDTQTAQPNSAAATAHASEAHRRNQDTAGP